MRRLNLPFNNLYKNPSGEGSGLGGGSVTGSRAGLCGGVGRLPADDNVSEVANQQCGLGQWYSDDPGSGRGEPPVCGGVGW
jgi:hypothetical protein